MTAERRSGRVGAAAATAVQLSGPAAGAITTLVIARSLGAGGTGTYAAAGQFLLGAMMVGGIGLRTGIAYEIASGRISPRAAATEATMLSLLLGAIAGAAGFALYELGSDSVFTGIDREVGAALSAAVPFAVAWWVLGAIPLAAQDYRAFAVLQSGGFVLVALLVVPLAISFGIDGALVGLSAAFAIAGIASIAWALRRTAGERSGGWELAESVRVGIRGAPLEMLQLLPLRPDILIVAAYGSTADVGVYSLAVTLTTIGWILPQALSTVALPRVASLEATAPGQDQSIDVSTAVAARALRHAVLLAVLAGAGVALLLLLAPLVLGDDFDRTVGLGLIMLPGVIALALGRVIIALLLGMGRGNAVLAIGATVVPAALLAYLLLIPDGGPTAAAIVSGAAYVLTTVGAAIELRRTGSTRS